MTATNDDKLLQLCPRQSAAVELLCGGKNDRETAEAVGVDRTTITRWRLYHPAFQAAYNARRLAMQQALSAQLHSLADLSIQTLAAELIKNPDPALALQVLRLIGLPSLLHTDSITDANVILERQVEAEMAQARQVETAWMESCIHSSVPDRQTILADLMRKTADVTDQ